MCRVGAGLIKLADAEIVSTYVVIDVIRLFSTLHYTTLHYTTLHYTTLHYTTLHYTTLGVVNKYLRKEYLLCGIYTPGGMDSGNLTIYSSMTKRSMKIVISGKLLFIQFLN